MLRSFLAGVIAATALSVAPAKADPEAAFFQSVSGRWVGPGEIVAGKYAGTKFTCDLSGGPEASVVGLSLDGSCRVGIFAQPMTARIKRQNGKLVGAFLDGAEGAGLDITSGRFDGERMVFALDRKQLNGAMVARMTGQDKLAVTVSVQVGSELVPVIGMNLTRQGPAVRQSSLQP